jgi:hypothetical protein
MRDRFKHGTYSRGTQRYNAKINDQIALNIYNSKESHAALARKYGVGTSTVRAIRLGNKWKHATSNTNEHVKKTQQQLGYKP